jgi:hypothetical protein
VIDIGSMEHSNGEARAGAGFWEAVTSALAAIARRTGCSLKESPLPEIREVARDLNDWQQKQPVKRV